MTDHLAFAHWDLAVDIFPPDLRFFNNYGDHHHFHPTHLCINVAAVAALLLQSCHSGNAVNCGAHRDR